MVPEDVGHHEPADLCHGSGLERDRDHEPVVGVDEDEIARLTSAFAPDGSCCAPFLSSRTLGGRSYMCRSDATGGTVLAWGKQRLVVRGLVVSTGTGEAEVEDGIGLAAAIEMIRGELLAARASGEQAAIRLPVESVKVELAVVAATDVEGRAGFKVPVVNLELGGSASRLRERTSTVTVVFGPPVDGDGNPVQVTETGPEMDG